jgi:hypothetical protein
MMALLKLAQCSYRNSSIKACQRCSTNKGINMAIPFEEFEKSVMQKILEKDTSINRILRDQYKIAKVTSREFTGVGFFTDLEVPDNATVVTEPVEYGYGNIWASINNSEVWFGFVLFIKGGKMICLEGFTCADSWPDEIHNFTLYHSDEKGS